MFYQAKIISNGFYGVCEVVPSACVSGKVYGNNTVGLGNINALYWCFVYYYGDSCITKYSNVPASFLSRRASKKGHLQGVLFCWSRHSFIEPGFLAPRRRKKSGSHSPPGVTRLKQLSIVLAEESPKQGVGRAEKARRQTTTMRRRVDRASVPHNETFTRRNEQILANSRHRRDSGIRLQCILIKKMTIGIFGQGSRSEPLPYLFRRVYT